MSLIWSHNIFMVVWRGSFFTKILIILSLNHCLKQINQTINKLTTDIQSKHNKISAHAANV